MSLQLPRGKKANAGAAWGRRIATIVVVALLAAIVWQTAAGWFAPKSAETNPEVAGAAPAATRSTEEGAKESTGAASSSATPVEAASTDPASPPKIAAADGKIVLESRGYLIPAHQILVSPRCRGWS